MDGAALDDQAADRADDRSGLAYVRGDTPRLRADVAIDGDRRPAFPTRPIREVRSLLAGAAERTVTSIDELRDAMRDVADLLAAGEVPAEIPKLGGTTFEPAEVAEAILDGLGDRVDDDVRTRVLGRRPGRRRARRDHRRGRLAVDEHAAVVAERLRAEPTVDLVAVTAEHAERPVGQLVATFDRGA